MAQTVSVRSMRLLSRRLLVLQLCPTKSYSSSPLTGRIAQLQRSTSSVASPLYPALSRLARPQGSAHSGPRAPSYSTSAATKSAGADATLTPEAAPAHLDAAERDIFATLARALSPTALEVEDVSGGCGSMYAVRVTSEAFRGLGVVKQHRLVTGALGERVKGWHGVRINTAVP